MNKLRAVLLRGFARDVLAAGRSSVDIGRILDTGGLLIARLPKGMLGEDTARLLGSLRPGQDLAGRPSPRATP